MLKLLGYADAFLTVIDPALNPRQPAAARRLRPPRRSALGMGTGLHSFGPNEPPLLGMDFPIELQLDRNFG
jgi:hypothetical protein